MAKEAVGAMRWQVEMDGMTQLLCKEVSGGDAEIEIIENRATGAKGNVVVQKIPGVTKYSNLILRRAVTDDMGFWSWIEKCLDGQVEGNRKNGTLTCYAPDNSAVAKFSFTNAWAAKYKHPQVDAAKNEVAVEELELAVETCKRQSV